MPDEVHHQSRREDRVARIQALFAWNFQGEPTSPGQDQQFASIQEMVPHIQRIDSFIMHYAPKHTITDFNKMDLAILRQALYELLYTSTPALVVINEAIEIAKEFGSDQSSRFVNGVLGTFWDERQKGLHATNTDSTVRSAD